MLEIVTGSVISLEIEWLFRDAKRLILVLE